MRGFGFFWQAVLEQGTPLIEDDEDHSLATFL